MCFRHIIVVSFLLLWMPIIVSSQSTDYNQLIARSWKDSPFHDERDFLDGNFRRGSGLDGFSIRELVNEVEHRIHQRGLPAVLSQKLQDFIKKGTTWITKTTPDDASRLAKFIARVKTIPAQKRLMRKELIDKERSAAKAAAPMLKVKVAAVLAKKDDTPKPAGKK